MVHLDQPFISDLLAIALRVDAVIDSLLLAFVCFPCLAQ